MKIAALAAALFACAFLAHWLVWRLRVPRRPILALLLIFLGALPIGLAATDLGPPAWPRPEGFWQHLHIALFHVAMSLAYIVTYSALEESSPSLTLVAFVFAAGTRGRSREELYGLISDDAVVGSRFRALIRGGLIADEGGVYRLTPRGRRWAGLCRCIRLVLRLQKGG
jgi:hypothetical protein